MSHPHDGFDSESGTDYDAAGETYFAWLGDESDTVMHYLSVSNGFGRHNQDNMYRWETAGYLNWANAVAGDILASPEAPRAMTAVLLADRKARQARDAFEAWRYLEGATSAREAYVTLKQAADSIGVVSAALAESQRMAALGIGPRKGRLPAALPQGVGARPPSEFSAGSGPRGLPTAGHRTMRPARSVW